MWEVSEVEAEGWGYVRGGERGDGRGSKGVVEVG